MFFRCLLLVLICLQDFTIAENRNGPDCCCFSYQAHKIPERVITGYKVTDQQCTKPAVIFTLKSGHLVCTDPGTEWVQQVMKGIDQNLFASSVVRDRNVWGRGPCCFSYQTHRIPVRLITEYKGTDRQCTKPGVIFILQSGRRVCADPDVQWVKNNMNTTDQRLYASMIQTQMSS